MESFKSCHVEPVSMKVKSALALSSLLLPFTINYVYAQEPVIMEQVSDNGSVKVQLFWPEVLPDELYNIELRFLNPQSNEPITDLIYNVEVMQDEEPIEIYTDQHTADGRASFEVVFPEDGTGPAQVIVVVTGMGSGTTNMDESVVFNVQVVPEFPALLAIVMALPLLVAVVLSRKMKSNKQIL